MLVISRNRQTSDNIIQSEQS